MANGKTPQRQYVTTRQATAGLRGFTLTEIAIVLGIVGIIIAAIFIATSATQYRIRLNQGLDEISLIVGNMRALYASQNAKAAPAVQFGATGEATFIQQGVFPKEMLRSPGNAVADNPWDNTAANGSAEIAVNVITTGQFIVEYLNVPADICADLLVNNSVPGPDTGLMEIDVTGPVITKLVYNAATSTYQLPVTPVQAAAACVAVPPAPNPPNPLYTIEWYYSLGS